MPRRSALLIFLLIGAALGARVFFALHQEPSPLLQYTGRAALLRGVVADDPDVRATAVRVTLAVSTLNGSARAGGAYGKVLAVLPRDTALHYGDTVVVRGLLEEPQSFETQGGRTFDYAGYLQARGISAIVQRAQLYEQEEGSAGVLRTLFALKHAYERALERVMQEPMAALMEGFLLGEKSGLPEGLTQAFVAAGLIHVVVLSGYNIGVVSEWTLRFFAFFLPRRLALGAVAIVIILFALMAGGGMATVRACLMGLIAILARYLNRPAAAMRALALAAAAMVLYNPLALFDVGFVLSIAATFGLITIAPWVEGKLTLLPAGGIRATAATTIAAQLFVLPALLYYTGVLSLVSVPANVIFLPFVPLAMLLGFVAGVLALIHPVLALLPGLLADALLRAMIGVVQIFSSLPLAAVVIPAFPVWVAWAAYAPLIVWAMWLYWQTAPQVRTS